MYVSNFMIFFLSYIAFFSSLLSVSFPNPVFSVLFLILCFVSSSLVLILSGAEFIGLTVIVVYVGAIAVLFLFVVMMLDLTPRISIDKASSNRQRFFLPFCLSLFFFLSSLEFFSRYYPFVFTFYTAKGWVDYVEMVFSKDDIVSLSMFLFDSYSTAFLMAGFLLFASLLGSIVVTLRRRRGVRRQEVSSQVGRSAVIHFYSRTPDTGPRSHFSTEMRKQTFPHLSFFYSLIGFQSTATPIREGIVDLHNYIFIYLTFIFFFVFSIFYSIIDTFLFSTRYPNSYEDLVVRKTSVFYGPYLTHFPLLEVVWTVLPGFVLLAIALPSFTLLYAMDEVIDPSLTLKALGHQWYWSYEYSDLPFSPLSYDSYMVEESALPRGGLRLLEVDNPVVLPSLTHIRVLVTSEDVLHSWRVPSLGVKVDAVPGRLNQLSIYARREGVFYGQCSELCGVNHGFMPISVRVVSLKEFISWRSSNL